MQDTSRSRLGRKVSRLRQARQWSRRYLAEEAALSYSTILKIEGGHAFPNPATIRALAAALDLSPGELLRPWEEDEFDWRVRLETLEQQPLGTRWIEANGVVAIDPSGGDTDWASVRDPIVRQLHEAVREKARSFNEASARLDNAFGWHGIAAASRRFFEAVQRPTEDIPHHLGTLYSALLELGSFLEQDARLPRGSSGIDALDPDVHRALSDLITTAAPWLRRFPTIRDLDDATSAFLTPDELVDPGVVLIRNAQETELISASDAAAVSALVEAAKRGQHECSPAQGSR